MYKKTERPLTHADRRHLEAAAAEEADALRSARVWALHFAAVELGLGVAGVLLLSQQLEFVPPAFWVGAVVFALLPFVLILTFCMWRWARNELTQLRQALEDGTVEVESFEADAVFLLEDAAGHGRSLYVLRLGPDRLAAFPRFGYWPGWPALAPWQISTTVPARWEIVYTRSPRRLLRATAAANSTVDLQVTSSLQKTVGKLPLGQLAAHLARAPVFSGILESLAEALRGHVTAGAVAAAWSVRHHRSHRGRDRVASQPGATAAERWEWLRANLELALSVNLLTEELQELLRNQGGAAPQHWTAGDLARVAEDYLDQHTMPGPANLLASFRRLRDLLAEVLALPRGQVRPASLIADLFPDAGALERAATVAARLGLPPPVLDEGNLPPRAAAVAAALAACLLPLFALFVVVPFDRWALTTSVIDKFGHIAWSICGVPILAILLLRLPYGLLGRLVGQGGKPRFHPYCLTVKDLAAMVARHEGNDAERTEQVAWNAVRQMIADMTGRAPAEITRETPLLATLGLDPPP